MTDRVWVLGASDPEMELIERLLVDAGERVVYALTSDGRRVTAAEAYRMAPLSADATPWGGEVYLVECDTAEPWPQDAEGAPMPYRLVRRSDAQCEPGDPDDRDECYVRIRRIDHHRPGDPGYGRPPAEFLPASSIGQVLAILRGHIPPFFDGGEWITSDGGEPRDVGGFLIGMPYAERVPHEIVLAAAADHCLAAAYRGECPGVDPDALMRWRVETRAVHQGRSPEEILADVERAREALRAAPTVQLADGIDARDMREAYTVQTVLVVPFTDGATVDSAGVGDAKFVVFGPRAEGAWDEGGHHTFVEHGVPELPEAAAREGVCFVARLPGPNGRTKIVCQAGSPEQIRAFMTVWAPAQGLSDIYGDPARGFAGGYMPGME